MTFLCWMAWKLKFLRLLVMLAILCNFLVLNIELIKNSVTHIFVVKLFFILRLSSVKICWWLYISFSVCCCSLGTVSNWTKIPPPLFKKVVIVLIDALRDDFVFGSKGKQFMPYTTQVIEKGTSYSFIAEAKPPTVTMPRIKVSALFPFRVFSIWGDWEGWCVSCAQSWYKEWVWSTYG